ncbi:MAG: hypothetical protein P1V20_09510 [Verrucomicrobiales bacterium]|nr:hypothetical protein [Verrucomicrobiales bacterium]
MNRDQAVNEFILWVSGDFSEVEKAPFDDKKLDIAVEAFNDSKKHRAALLNQLVPLEDESSFLIVASRKLITARLGNTPIVGIVTLARLENTKESERTEFITQILESGDFWLFLRGLPIVFGQLKFKGEPFLNFLVALLQKIGSNFSRFHAMDAIRAYAGSFPEEAVELVSEISSTSEVTEYHVEIGGCLLGEVKTLTAAEGNRKAQLHIENKLSQSTSLQLRLIRLLAIKAMMRKQPVSTEEFWLLVEEMNAGHPDERLVALECVLDQLDRLQRDEIVDETYLNWIVEKGLLSVPQAQYRLLSRLSIFISQFRNNIPAPYLNAIERAVGSLAVIDKEHKGIWREFFDVLSLLCYADVDISKRVFKSVVQKNGGSEFDEMLTGDEGVQFIESLRSQNIPSLVSHFLFAPSGRQRSAGIALFEILGISDLSSKDSPEIDSNILRGVLFQFRIGYRRPNVISRFYPAIEPLVRKMDDETKKIFMTEIQYEAMNLPGQCLRDWKKYSRRKLFSEPLKIVDDYFKQKAQPEEQRIFDFIMPGIEQGAHLAWRKRAKIVSDAMQTAKDQSPFLGMIRSKTLLYGSSFDYETEEFISSPTEFTRISTSEEEGRMPYIDPEGEAMRYCEAISVLKQLEQIFQGDE